MSRWSVVALCVLCVLGVLGCRGDGSDSEHGGEAGSTAEDFGNADPGGRDAPTAGAPRAGAGGPDDPGCEREVRLTAVTLGEPPPFDVIIVADHSQSIGWSRDDLAAGLSTLLADVRGRAARVFVLTPTQYGPSSAAAIDRVTGDDLVLWQDAASGEAFAHAMTEYSQVCADPAGAAIECPPYERRLMTRYSLDGAWTFVMPQAIAEITPEMTDAEIAEQQAAVTEAILGLAGTGSPNEQPLCTLNRYLAQGSAALPKRAAFVVISDEDDRTPPEDCLREYHYEVVANEDVPALVCNDAVCDAYQYLLSRPGVRSPISFTCAPVDDLGTPHPENGFTSSTTLNGRLASDCTEASPAAPCGPGGLDWAEETCGSGHVVQNCRASCLAEPIAGCSLMTTEASPDYCTSPFTHDGVAYADLADYCTRTVGEETWTDCRRTGVMNATQLYGTHTLTPVVEGTGARALATAFRSGVDAAFGPGGSVTAVIGFEPGGDCAPQTGQGFAINLATIATSPSDDVFSICGDYSPALERVREFASYLVDTELELVLEDTEGIESVQAEGADGALRPLDPSLYRYDRARGLLLLDPNALGPADVGLSVEIERGCAPRVD